MFKQIAFCNKTYDNGLNIYHYFSHKQNGYDKDSINDNKFRSNFWSILFYPL